MARLTVTPPTWTGFNAATGVSAPVRPTLTKMSSMVVASSSAGNLYAMAQRGVCETAPRRRRWSSESTLMTLPSISYGNSWRIASIRRYLSFTPSSVSQSSLCGFVRRPSSRSSASFSQCVANVTPGVSPTS